MASNDKIQFDHKGIGELLIQTFLKVPPNQREYSWEEEHIRDLFSDYSDAIGNKGSHFLGTIVLTSGTGDIPEISDGQQRLATTTILLAAIRDYILNAGDSDSASAINSSFLKGWDFDAKSYIPKLRLNTDDNTFFMKRVLSDPGSLDRNIKTSQESHRRIEKAYELATKHVHDIVEPHKDKIQKLLDLVKFITTNAEVIALRVPDQMNAFMMFETLNDRGLRASQADLLKNYLLGFSRDRIKEAQQWWSKMVGTLDTLDQTEITVTFLHHLLITKYGPTRASEVFDKVKQTVNTQSKALQFLEELAASANDYVALFNSDHNKWNAYGTRTRKNIATINRDLRVNQIRPLMFAVSRHFSKSEAEEAFRRFVCWSVRVLIVGLRGGLLDRNYSICAQQIGKGQIKTAEELTKALTDVIPTDPVFEKEFAVARVSQAHLARYYLRALELKKIGNPEPEMVPFDDEKVINLEHILPESSQANWPNIDADTADAFYRRIGNMVILQFKKNSTLGNTGFSEKKPVLAGSGFLLTSGVAKYDNWGPIEIENRQAELASLAVKTWPIKP